MSALRMLALPWQQWTNRVTKLPLLAIGIALFALPLLAALSGKLDAFRYAAIAVWCVAIVGLWLATAWGLQRQNHPTAARLVPGHVRRLRWLSVLWWLLPSLVFGLGFGLVIGHPGPALLVTAAVLLLAQLAMRWPLLWLPLWALTWALPIGLPRWAAIMNANPQLQPLLQALTEPSLLTALLLLALGALSSALVIQSGGAAHRHSCERRERRMQAMNTAPEMRRQWGWLPDAVFSLLHAPYRAALRRGALAGSPVLRRALLMLGPSVHWSGYLGTLLVVMLPMLLLLGLGLGAARPGINNAAWFGLSLGFTMMALAVVLQLPVAMQRSRREQALLVLAPAMPRGIALSRGIAAASLALSLGAWTCGVLMVLALSAWLGHDPRPALVASLAALPLNVSVLRDWSHAAPHSELAKAAPGLLCGAGGLGLLWLMESGVPFAGIAGASVSLTIALALWRWQRLSRLPAAWPSGRLG
jgi:hypothetical protein